MDVVFLALVFWRCLFFRRQGEVCEILEQPSELLRTSVLHIFMRRTRITCFLGEIEWRETHGESRAKVAPGGGLVVWTIKHKAYEIFTKERLALEKSRSSDKAVR